MSCAVGTWGWMVGHFFFFSARFRSKQCVRIHVVSVGVLRQDPEDAMWCSTGLGPPTSSEKALTDWFYFGQLCFIMTSSSNRVMCLVVGWPRGRGGVPSGKQRCPLLLLLRS